MVLHPRGLCAAVRSIGLTADWVFAHTKTKGDSYIVAANGTVIAPPQITLIKGAKDNMDQQKPVDPTPLNQLKHTPQWIDCPFCHQRTETRIEKKQLGPLQM